MSDAPRVVERQLPPWEQLPYFQRPKITTFTNIGGATKVADANPLRVGLIFAATGSVNVYLLPDSGVSTGNGIKLVATAPWAQFLQSEVGPVVQAEWWAVPDAAGANLTVIENLFAKWPGE